MMVLMLSALALGIFSGSFSLIVLELIPIWVFTLMAVLLVIFNLPHLWTLMRRDATVTFQQILQKPLERAAALSLFLQFFLPWADQLLNLGLF